MIDVGTQKKRESYDKDWYPKAAKLLKGEMLRLDYSVSKLVSRLEDVYEIKTTPNALGKKINKGGFSLAFFILCMEAMGISVIDLYNTRPPEPKHAPEPGLWAEKGRELIGDDAPPYERPGTGRKTPE